MFKFCNPHPEGKIVKDCVKRAIVIATGFSYHEVSVMLNRYRKESGGAKFNSNENWKPFVENVLLGRKIAEDMRYANNGHRYTVEEFADSHFHTYILRCSKHLVAVSNGDYLDTWNSGNKGVYIAYRIPNKYIIEDNIKRNFKYLSKNLF